MLNESVKRVTKSIIDFAEQADKSLSDGWQWLKDLLSFTDELAEAPGAIKAAPEAWAVIKAGMPHEDYQEWIKYIADEYDIDNDVAEERAEAISKWVIQTAELVVIVTKKPPVV